MNKTYLKMIKEAEEKALVANKEVAAIKWMFFYSDYAVAYDKLRQIVDESLYNKFMNDVNEYIVKNRPVQYIINKASFMGYDFYIDERVFIPRTETEQLVEQIIYEADTRFADKSISVADVCAGSGIIGITLKKELLNSNVSLYEYSTDAIEVIKKNALMLEANVEIFEADFIKLILKDKLSYDIFACNPPYIKNSENLDSMIIDNEPNMALFGGIDGLDFYIELFQNFDKLINKNGFMALEMGYDQKILLEEALKKFIPDKKYKFIKDYADLDRMLFIYN